MWDWVSKLHELTQLNISVAAVTVIDTGGSSPRDAGAKMLVVEDGEIFGTIGGGNLEKLVIEQAINCIKENICGKYTFNLGAKAGQCCGGVMEVFIETATQSEQLIIFGAGHVAQAVAETMEGTPFKVHLIDERLAHDQGLVKKGLNSHVKLHSKSWQESFKECFAKNKNKNNYVVIMTHSHQLDEEILHSLLSYDCKYLGLIGSETKWEHFQKRLLEKGVSKEQLKTVRCPIGRNTGGKAPKEVAISLAAELLEIFYQKE